MAGCAKNHDKEKSDDCKKLDYSPTFLFMLLIEK